MDVVLGDFGCCNGIREGFYTALMEVLMRCFVGGPVMSVTCIGITHGHSRL